MRDMAFQYVAVTLYLINRYCASIIGSLYLVVDR
jgi:hypothetical protein